MLSPAELQQLCESACEAARTAGAYIAAEVGKHHAVEGKEGGDTLASQVVTAVDLRAQELILAALAPSIETYDLGLLTEESADSGSRFSKAHFWCVDPLDGTLPFTEQRPGYAVSIALLTRAGEPLIGVVFDPVERVLYSAIQGNGANRNGRQWQLLTPTALRLCCDRSLSKHPRYDALCSALANEATARNLSVEVRSTGGAVMNALWLMEAGCGWYGKPPKRATGGGSIWDYAATACIARELGALATAFDGSPLALNGKSTFMHQQGISMGTDDSLTTIARYALNS